MEDDQPYLQALKTSTGVGGPCSMKSSHECSESSATGWASTGVDHPDSSDTAEVGNAAAMEKLDLYLRLAEDCLGAVQRISSYEFNNEQCEYLADKLQMVIRSASLYLNVLRGDLSSSTEATKVVEVFKFLLALAKQIKSFVQGCCNDSWIQSAMTLTNVWEYVASVGFNLELCRVECPAPGCLTLDEVEEIHKVEVEVVKKKAFSDVDALSQKILLEGPSLSNENKDLAFYLLQRLNQVKPIPGAMLKLFEGSPGYDGGWFGRLMDREKPSGQLGRGKSGTVHKVTWLGTSVAEKMFFGEGTTDFEAEVEVLSALCHPNVMSIFSSEQNHRGRRSIIMELMDDDLHNLIERRLEEKSSSSDDICPSPFPISEAVDIMLQISEGVKYLHGQRIAHRDLKSMNILAKNLCREDFDGYVHVKVADFGMSKTIEKSTRYSTMSYNLGTTRWMAPEIIRLRGSDQGSSSSSEGPMLPFKCDIYSFAMVCFEILTGEVPFSSDFNDIEVKRQVLQGKRPELPKDPQKCPPLLRELIKSCWSPNPQERPTFIDICSALKYLKYLLMTDYQRIKKAEQSRLNCADISDSMELLSNKHLSTNPHEEEDTKAVGRNIEDYQTTLENRDDEVKDVRDVGGMEFTAEKDVDGGTPLFPDEDIQSPRGGNMESLTSALSFCEMQVKEFKDLLPLVKVYRHRCKNLVETLVPAAESTFERCHKTLNELERLGVDDGRVPSHVLCDSQELCFQTLVGLSGQLLLVVDILRKYASQNFHRAALELAYLPPLLEMPKRWSEFSLSIRNCEWSMDIVDLAFHMLDKLLGGSRHIFQDVSFRWSEEKCRMVLQAPDKFRRGSNKSVVDLNKELEVKDLKDLHDLIYQLRPLGEATFGTAKPKWGNFWSCVDLEKANIAHIRSDTLSGPTPHADYLSLPWRGFSSCVDHEKANIAYTRSDKFSGPIPRSIYLPSMFRVDPDTLEFRELLKIGSSRRTKVGRYTWFGEDVAVKCVRILGSTMDKYKESLHKFEKKAAILACVQHPNVVRFMGWGFMNETGMLVMELMDHDLRTVLDSRIQYLAPGSPPFPVDVAIDMITQIAQAMNHLKDHKILHSDLKAGNILVNIIRGKVSESRQMRPANFSTILPRMEKYYVVKVSGGLTRRRPHSVSRRMPESAGWMAPEVFPGKDTEVTDEYKWPAEVYSFGMTCYEILTGNFPFANIPNPLIYDHIMAGKRPEGLNELEIPELLKDLVKKCWATNPDERPTFEVIMKLLWECRAEAIMQSFEHHISLSRSVPSVGTSALNFEARAAEMSTLASEAVKPRLIGDSVVIDLTADLLGVSSTGYVIKTKFPGEHGLSVPCVLKRTSVVNQAPPDLARLKHKHVVHLIDHWIEEKDLFLVMEVMDGDLAELIARTKNPTLSPFSLHVAVDLMMQIGQAMLFLHEAGVSHPHLKCENVLYRATGQPGAYRVDDVVVKLGGFRCSRPADLESENRDVLCFGLTCVEILTGDLQRSIVLASPSIPEAVPAILKDCIVSCLETHPKSSDVVRMLSRAKSYIIEHCKDEHLCVGESMENDPAEEKMDSDREEAFAVHQLHPESNNIVSTSASSTFVFFHGFYKGPDEWRRTWMTRDNKLVWPQEWLPEDLGAGNIRVLSVSFDADSTLSNNYDRYEISKILVQRLVLSWNLGDDNEALFLIGHSFGGVLIKSLVTEAQDIVQKSIDQREAEMCKKFLKSLARIVFYSVPLEFESYISECKKIVVLQRSSLLQSFQKDTRFVADMNKLSTDFERAVPENVKILAFLEGKPMSKRYILVTEKSYEALSLGWEWHKIDKDNHFEVCRPNSKSHSGYKILLDHLRQDMEAVN